jgi:hypothetical protein
MPRPTIETPRFGFKTEEDANAFREQIAAASLRYARPICWHDNNKVFPKEIVGASCFVLRFATGLVGVTAAHVIREYQKAKAATPSLVCQLHLMPFDLDGALIDIDDDLDIATFAISERQLKTTLTDAFDVSARWPLDDIVKPDASIQLIGYPENIRVTRYLGKGSGLVRTGDRRPRCGGCRAAPARARPGFAHSSTPAPRPWGYGNSGCRGRCLR